MHPSTFSIVVFDPTENAWGIAVASKFPAVGSVVPWARAGYGAVATQSYANTSYGPQGLEMMGRGLAASEVLGYLLAGDPERERRQVGLVDAAGQSATFTGRECQPWAGGIAGPGYAIQGNILAGEQVVESMLASYTQDSGSSLMWRLHRALLSGDRSGGDKRGRQSAAIYIVKTGGGYGGMNDRWIDYRVDDHPDPVHRLGELLELHDLYFGESSDLDRISLNGDALRDLQMIMQQAGCYSGPLTGEYDSSTRTALVKFIGNENFEERTDFEQGLMDRPVLEYLLRCYGAK